MKLAAVIAEYNPFHNGHAFHLAQTRAAGATHIVAVMSGGFVQRGEPAAFSQAARARAALLGGADLVIELPVPWAMSPAQSFARAGVSLAAALGSTDMLSFGSECGDISRLCACVDALGSEKTSSLLKDNLAVGMSFAAARENAVRQVLPAVGDILSSPNDTLACEYISAARRCGAHFDFLAVKREGCGHNDSDGNDGFMSASALRDRLLAGESISDFVPDYAAQIYENEIKSMLAPAATQRLETAVIYKMRTVSAAQLALAPDVSEGIENRIVAAARSAKTLEELYLLAKSKRYSHARIRRIVMSAFLGITAEDCSGTPPYIRVLGFNERGREVLSAMKGKARLPVVMRCSDVSQLDDRCKNTYRLECLAADIRALCLPEIGACGSIQTENLFVR